MLRLDVVSTRMFFLCDDDIKLLLTSLVSRGVGWMGVDIMEANVLDDVVFDASDLLTLTSEVVDVTLRLSDAIDVEITVATPSLDV